MMDNVMKLVPYLVALSELVPLHPQKMGVYLVATCARTQARLIWISSKYIILR